VLVFNTILATPATSLTPKCTGYLPFLWNYQPRGEGGYAAWATTYPPYHGAQACALERTLQLHHCMVSTQHGEQQFTGHKPLFNWRRTWRQGLLSTVGEICRSQWTTTARSKLGSPQSIRCCPATFRFLHWVHGE
jgi:hypothetical protein